MPSQLSPLLPSPTASASSPRSPRVPLLSLAQPAIHLSDGLATDEQEFRVGEIWNVISRAADIVKDGDRLENLAWRHWGQPAHKRRTSASSFGTESSASPRTPDSIPPPFLHRSRSFERRSFGGALKLLLDHDNFKDWVTDAKSRLPLIRVPSPTPTPPVLSLPDTPIANVEIRLVEPTPVPSRVGSLGASMGAGGLLGGAMVPPALNEDEEETIYEEEVQGGPPKVIKARARSPKRKNRFFINSSPNKGSGSDTSHLSQPSPVAPSPQVVQQQIPVPPEHNRRSSGESSGELVIKRKKDTEKKKHVPLSNMKGKFASEKRKAAEALKARTEAEEEEGGWEDEGEEDEEEWDDEPESPAKARPTNMRRQSTRSTNNSSSNLDLAQLTRQISRRTSSPNREGKRREPPPPPAPTPLKKMSKKEKLAAAAERAKIEAELEAQEKRKMFAKREIFGENHRQNSQGLLTNLFKRGGSMVDLTQAPNAPIRSSPTHVGLSSLSRSPAPGQNLLRSKSAVAIPVQTGVSVTAGPSGLRTSDERRPPPEVDLESSGEESEDDFLASSSTRRKIAELAAKRDARTEAKVQPVPLAALPILDPNGIAQPLSPTTRRRTIIMREMSESLRRNIILEREKSAGRRTSFAAQPRAPDHAIQTSSSALNLTNYSQGAPLERHNSQPSLSRDPAHNTSPLSNDNPVYKTSLPNTTTRMEPLRRKPQPNVLGGFLRPLTRVGEPHQLGRVQSSATIHEMGTEVPQSSSLQYEAPAMQRRATDGPGREGRDMERERMRRELQKRSDTMDTSYRSHGW